MYAQIATQLRIEGMISHAHFVVQVQSTCRFIKNDTFGLAAEDTMYMCQERAMAGTPLQPEQMWAFYKNRQGVFVRANVPVKRSWRSIEMAESSRFAHSGRLRGSKSMRVRACVHFVL